MTGRARTRPRSTAAATDSEALPAGPRPPRAMRTFKVRKMNMPLVKYQILHRMRQSHRTALQFTAQARTNNQSPRARPAQGAATATPPPGAGVSSGLPRVHGEEPDHAREG